MGEGASVKNKLVEKVLQRMGVFVSTFIKEKEKTRSWAGK